MGPERTETNRHGLSADYSARTNSDKAVTLPTYKATNQSGEFGTVAARPNIVEEHTIGAGNGTWPTSSFVSWCDQEPINCGTEATGCSRW